MRRVHVAPDPGSAEIVRGLLESMGIQAVVEGEMLYGVRGDVGMNPASLPSVHVRDEDVDRAVALLNEHKVSIDLDVPAVPESRARTAFDWAVLGALGLAAAGLIVAAAMSMLSWAAPAAGVVVVLLLIVWGTRVNRAS